MLGRSTSLALSSGLQARGNALHEVGRVFGETRFRDSSLYDEAYAHILRNAGKKKLRAG